MAARVRFGLELVSGREPSDEEVAGSVRMIEDFRKEGLDDAQALKYFALMALNLNEFVYLD